jgi:uncharacterized membrane protein YgdD (TMEM256/DUF423 family)
MNFRVNSINVRFLMVAAVMGALSVIAGAMLAHQLKHRMTEEAVAIYETAVRYQFYHVFALLITGVLGEKFPGRFINQAGNCFIAGIILFSGSLYCISALITMGKEVPFALGILTPAGGFLFILGWIFLGMAVWIRRST